VRDLAGLRFDPAHPHPDLSARTLANRQGFPFTPLSADRSERLSFPGETVTVITGDPLGHVPGRRAVVQIDGRRYEVHGEPCAGSCACDARLVPIAVQEKQASGLQLSATLG
jgi:hypothetical protein